MRGLRARLRLLYLIFIRRTANSEIPVFHIGLIWCFSSSKPLKAKWNKSGTIGEACKWPERRKDHRPCIHFTSAGIETYEIQYQQPVSSGANGHDWLGEPYLRGANGVGGGIITKDADVFTLSFFLNETNASQVHFMCWAIMQELIFLLWLKITDSRNRLIISPWKKMNSSFVMESWWTSNKCVYLLKKERGDTASGLLCILAPLIFFPLCKRH